MRKLLLSLSLVSALAFAAFAEVATDGKKPCSKPCGSAKANAASESKSPCGGAKATVVSDSAKPCSKEGAKPCCKEAKNKPCCQEAKAKTVAVKDGKSPCGSKAKTAASKPCCGEKSKAKTVAAKSPCGSKAKTVAAKSPCGSHKAKTVAKDGKSPCGSKAKTVAAKSPCGGGDKTLASAKGGCDKSRCSKSMWQAAGVPMVRCVVGDKTLHCPLEAAKLAKETGETAAYYVGETEYSDAMEAGRAWAKQLDDYLAEITTVKYAVGDKCVGCPMSAKAMAKKSGKPLKYRLASVDFGCDKSAAAAAEAARKAAEGVKMTMLVGEKEFCCKVKAREAAKSAGEPIKYRVGDDVVDCDVRASVMQALAKIDAALAALEKASSTS